MQSLQFRFEISYPTGKSIYWPKFLDFSQIFVEFDQSLFKFSQNFKKFRSEKCQKSLPKSKL